jgi:hypothetical protein
MKTFNRIEEATDYLNSESFSYPPEITYYEGKAVLKLFKLCSDESHRYRRISSSYGWASLKEVAVSGAKSYGLDAAGTLFNAARGNLFGSLKSYVSMMGKMGKSDPDIDDRLSAQNPDNGVYRQFERAYIYRQMFVYQYIKSAFPSQRARVASRRIGDEEGCVLFMYKL